MSCVRAKPQTILIWTRESHQTQRPPSFEVDRYVTYRDTDDPDSPDSQRYHLGRVINVTDDNTHVHCHATKGKIISHVQWSPLYQNDRGVYKIDDDRHGDPVIDQIPVVEEEWVLHYAVKLNPNHHITKQTRKQLAARAVTHHRLTNTFP